MDVQNILIQLKKSNYPIFIWGAGSMSIEIERCLEEEEIPIAGKFINCNRAYAHIVETKYQVYTIEELQQLHLKIDVIIGHGHYEKRSEIDELSFVNRLYIIPNPYLQYSAPNKVYVKANREKIEEAKKCLTDDISLKALDSYINFGLTGKIEFLLEQNICNGDMFQLEALQIKESERFVDVGAWEGDTIEKFLEKTNGSYDKIFAFEPEPTSFEMLMKKYNYSENMFLYQLGLGLKSGEFYMENNNKQSSHVVSEVKGAESDLVRIEVKTLDMMFKNERVDIVKIFVPFMFLDILKGGEAMIKRDRPRLIVNVSADNKSDVFDTILWINRLGLRYNIVLRYDFPMPTRLFLYAY